MKTIWEMRQERDQLVNDVSQYKFIYQTTIQYLNALIVRDKQQFLPKEKIDRLNAFLKVTESSKWNEMNLNDILVEY